MVALALPAILAIISLVSSVAMAVYAATRKPSKAREGSRFGLANNIADPGNPVPWGGGKPRFNPPLLSRWIELQNVNSFSSAESDPKVGLLLDCGAGPVDGSDLSVWLDDTPLFEVVDATSPLGTRRLVDVDGARKEWYFPKLNVRPDSVLLFVGGTPYAYSTGNKPGDQPGTVRKTVTDRAAPQEYTVPASSPISDLLGINTHTGALWPTEQIGSVTVEVTLQRYKIVGLYRQKLGSPEILTLAASDYKVETDKTGKQFATASSLEPTRKVGQTYLKTAEITEWRFTYEVLAMPGTETPLQTGEVVTDQTTRKSLIRFSTALPAGDVTAHYRSLPFGFEADVQFTKGEVDQDPLPGSERGEQQTRVVGLQLTQGLVRTFTTNETDDLVVGISSGTGGFYGMGGSGEIRGTTAEVRIRVRTTAAPDEPAPSAGTKAGDPREGWVEFVFEGLSRLPLHGKISGGTARWAFRASDAVANARAKAQQPAIQFPRAAYVVEVVRLTTDVTGGQKDMFFEYVTEARQLRFSFPARALLRVYFQTAKGLDREPEVAVQVKMRKQPIYRGTRKVPYSEQLARFLGNANLRLPPGVTTSGGFYDLSTFAYDPDLVEPDIVHEWTRNPVWIACGILLDPLVGGGLIGITRAHINWTSAKAAADFCDRQITFAGRTDTAAECDIFFAERLGLYEAACEALAGSGVAPVLINGKWCFPYDVDETDPTPVTDPLTGQAFTITDADVIAAEEDDEVDSLEIDSKREADVATDFVVEFPDEEAGFDTRSDPVYLPATDPNPAKRIVREISLPGVRRRWQAERVATQAQENERLNQRTVTLRPAGLRELMLEPGDVVVLSLASAQLSGRKARLLETECGSNLRVSMKFLLLGGAKPHGSFAGPSSGVIPGARPAPAPVPVSYILNVEEL